MKRFNHNFTENENIEFSNLQLEDFISSIDDLPTTIVTAASTAISTFRSNQELIETHKSSLFRYFGLSEDSEEEESATSTTDVSATDDTTTPTSGGATVVMTSLYCLVMLSSFIVRYTM